MRGPSDNIDWKPAIEHYYWDRMEAAYEVAQSLGTGLAGRYLTWYRMIEAEYVTRAQSSVDEPISWLSIEYVPEELGERIDSVRQTIIDACESVSARFGWPHGPATRIAIMARESDAPWVPGRDGFCIDKYPYEKICLPAGLVEHSERLFGVTAHEYAHVMTLNLSEGRVPRWLDESVAMVAGHDVDRLAAYALRDGKAPWRNVRELTAAYGVDRRDKSADLDGEYMAYVQSAILGRYLSTQGGDPALAQLMRAYANNSMWTEAKIAIDMLDATDEALREVYGFGVEALFKGAESWLRTGFASRP